MYLCNVFHLVKIGPSPINSMKELAEAHTSGKLEVKICQCQPIFEPFMISSNTDYNTLGNIEPKFTTYNLEPLFRAVAAGKQALIETKNKLEIYVGLYLTLRYVKFISVNIILLTNCDD